MADTPNLDKLERIFTALGTIADISIQPRLSEEGGTLWTVTRRTSDGFWVGQGGSLAGALSNLSLAQPERTEKPDLASLETLAA